MSLLCSQCIAQLDGPWHVKKQVRARKPKQDNPWTVLHIRPTDDEGVVQRAFKKWAKEHHPDHGGDPQEFIKLQRARDEALRRIRENE